MMIIGICDDEVYAQRQLTALLREHRQRQNMTILTYCSGQEMLDGGQRFDLVFLDIEMPEMSGLELAQQLKIRNPTLILVFVSAYYRYVSDTYHLDTFQFLLKPLEPARFHREFERCLSRFHALHGVYPITVGREKTDVPYKDICYISAEGRQICLYLISGEVLCTYKNIGQEAEALAKYHLCRCHQSYLVNLMWIKTLDSELVTVTVGKGTVILPVSRKYRPAFARSYHKFLLGER